jgi:hypothetical protein
MSSNRVRPSSTPIEFKLVFLTAFSIFLVAVTLGKLIPKRWRWNVSGHDESKSIIEVAKAAAYTSIPFAFM